MFALISPNEAVTDSTGTITGQRVAEVSLIEFPVAPPLFWVPCDPATVADQYYYLNGTVQIKP